ncbi:MAG: HAD-IIIC family phosphatase [Candidatus Eisenbacteria bacterium]|nr:HAD-IIIC family phosphatase [Candidatus Eisenbacteria bacterium]
MSHDEREKNPAPFAARAPQSTPAPDGDSSAEREETVKCLVWDLDRTLWDGILLEDERVRLRPGIRETLTELDRRGILHSIASRNDPETAMARLRDFDLAHFFLYPQIGWRAKPLSIARILEDLRLRPGALAFIDDDPFERDQMLHAHPAMRVFDACEAARLVELPAFRPRFVTADSRQRREMYQRDIERRIAEEEFQGPQEDFLARLDMRFSIARARQGDLERAEELTVRTHQLNSTGYTYSYEELDRLRVSPAHRLWIAELEDRYGSYGKIGLALLELGPQAWTIKLLLMSCRVMSRGVGSVFVQVLLRSARKAGVTLRAEFVPTRANRQMYVTLRFAGFREIDGQTGVLLLEHDCTQDLALPPHVRVELEEE